MAYFELILLILTIVSGVVALIDKLFFEKARWQEAAKDPNFVNLKRKARKKVVKAPIVADYCRSLFVVFLVVLIIRSFIVEPFRIPSGSMLPTLKIGDFITVNKNEYGLRWPVWHTAITDTTMPARGDIIVFHDGVNTKLDLIKRVIGLPGDRISYVNRQLTINGHKIPEVFIGKKLEPNDSTTQLVNEYREDLMGVEHDIYTMPWVPSANFKDLVVPKGELFVMGDNRDNSDDSRYWGFVKQDQIIGKATNVWLSWDETTGSVRWHRFGDKLN